MDLLNKSFCGLQVKDHITTDFIESNRGVFSKWDKFMDKEYGARKLWLMEEVREFRPFTSYKAEAESS
jgi:hypothetical protein